MPAFMQRVEAASSSSSANAADISSSTTDSRYFYAGDGTITVGRNGGKAQTIKYRSADGGWDPAGHAAVQSMWGVRSDKVTEQIDLRLIAALDYIQDKMGGTPWVLYSGFRSRTFNKSLRDKGRMAAQSSMHIEGGAADLVLRGVASAKVAEFARNMQCCGVGYYHGGTVHIDTGPVRHWDEVTSGTESREPQRNAQIMLSTEFDRYQPGETATLRMLRITEFPFSVPTEVTLECLHKGEWREVTEVQLSQLPLPATNQKCAQLSTYEASRQLTWQVPTLRKRCDGVPAVLPPTNDSVAAATLPSPQGRYRLRLKFCSTVAQTQPSEVFSNFFEIGG